MTQLRGVRYLRLALSPLAWPFVLLYAFVVRLKNAAFDFHLIRPRRLNWPVVSIGNLSVGGSGKTPMVMLLTRLLEEQGWSADVLSRGYGRKQQNATQAAAIGDWRIAGDEPTLMARRGLKVFVGTKRYDAGLLAEQQSPAAVNRAPTHVHFLDDGFQHRQLARVVNIVLLQRMDLEDEMLPLGRLREPLAALERADICVLRNEEADLVPRVLSLMRQTDPARVWLVDRKTVLPAISETAPPTAFAFCGIGNPAEFFECLRAAHVDLRGIMAFRDHHIYVDKDINRIAVHARASGARCLVTTEKDSVRLDPLLSSALETLFPLIIADLQLALIDQDRCIDTLKHLISQRFQITPTGMR